MGFEQQILSSNDGERDACISVSKPIRKICCIGAGYVGGPTCSVIASKNPKIEITIVDLNANRIEAWKSNDIPIHEPNLLETVQIGRDGTDGRAPNLFFSTDVDTAIAEADLIFVAVNTPTKTSGYGANHAADMTYVESAIERIAQVSRTDKIIVEKSTVPCGTARYLQEVLSSISHPGVHFDILSNPEFLAEGTAIKNLENPDRVLIGSEVTPRGLLARSSLAKLYGSWVPQDRIIGMNICSAELAKLAANAILAQRISSINALSAICETTGADVEEVAFAVGLDMRIGSKMLKASVGYGGSCLKKDVLHLAHFSDTLLLPQIGNYWRSVNEINDYQKDRFSQRIVTRLHNTLTDKKVAVLGFAFKKDTGDIRESAATSIVARLIAEKAEVAIYDPQVKAEAIWTELERKTGKSTEILRQNVGIWNSVYDACDQAHSVVIATEWDEFGNKTVERAHPLTPPETSSECTSEIGHTLRQTGECLTTTSGKINKMDWARVCNGMKYPRIVFDGRNIVDQMKLHDMGFQVECIGKSGLR